MRKKNGIRFVQDGVGTVKSIVEDRGFGFLTSLGKKIDDIFYHVKETYSELQVGNLVAFSLEASRKHNGKYEAANVLLLADLVDVSALVRIYLNVPDKRIADQLAGLFVDQQSNTIISQEIYSCVEYEFVVRKSSVMVEKRLHNLFTLMDVVTEIDEKIKVSITTLLITNLGSWQKHIFLIGNRLLPAEERYHYNVQEIFNSLDQMQRDYYYPYLSIEEQRKISAITAVETDEQLQAYLKIVGNSEVVKQQNHLLLRQHISFSPLMSLKLWAFDYQPDHPELRPFITELDHSTLVRVLNKIDLDNKITCFPFVRIDSEESYDLFTSFLQQCGNSAETVIAFELSGLTFLPSFYVRAIVDCIIIDNAIDYDKLALTVRDQDLADNLDLIKRLGWQSAVRVFSTHIKQDQFNNLVTLIQACDDFNKNDTEALDELVKLDIKTHLKLWLLDRINALDYRGISLYFFGLKNLGQAEEIVKKIGQERHKFFDVCLELFERYQDIRTTENSSKLLKLVKSFDADRFPHFLRGVTSCCGMEAKLLLWLKDLYESFHFEEYRLLFFTLSSDQQKQFIKKMVWAIKERKVNASFTDLLSLKKLALDPSLREKLGGDTCIDITVFVLLQLLQDLQVGSMITQEKIFQLIADNISSPKELLKLDGFFDHCDGRLELDYKAGMDDEEHYPLMEKRSQIPRGVVYCEGRKVIDKNTKEPSLCEKTGKEFWWCRNVKCYRNCISMHNSWQDFTLMDICEIFSLPLTTNDYETLLGYINKINRYLEHMNCRLCGEILRPQSRNNDQANTNYSFHRVSNFACLNYDCKERGKVIYLSHCTNGFCSGVIDQRDTVKCIPSSVGKRECGWYVCQDCLACCNTRGLDKRQYIYNHSGQDYRCHTQGHMDLGIICCPKCGTEMNAGQQKPKEFDHLLKWLLENCESSPVILKHGKRPSDGGNWFLLAAPISSSERKIFMEKLFRYQSYGFNIPDITQQKSSYMIAEPFDNGGDSDGMLKCPACEFNVDLRSDYEKLALLRSYHRNVKFRVTY